MEEFIKVMNSDQDDKELKAAFDAFDADGSGFITKQELRQAMTNCGSNVSERELNEMIASADANSDGKVNFEGKSSVLLQNPQHTPETGSRWRRQINPMFPCTPLNSFLLVTLPTKNLISLSNVIFLFSL